MSNSDYVMFLYRSLLNRGAGPGEIAFWVTVLEQWGWTRAQVYAGFLASAEYKSLKPLARLYDLEPAYAPVGSDFQSIVAQGLGNAGTAGDGFDVAIAAPILALADDANAISELDTFLSLADFVDGDFETGSLSDTVLNLAGFFAGGDSLLTHLGL